MSELKTRLHADMIATLKAGDKRRLGTIRLALASVKQKEVDDRIELDDAQVLDVLDKMVKQRRDSYTQYSDAGRDDLAAQESYEIEVLKDYLPEQLGESEVAAMVDAVIADTGAEGMRDMGKVMGVLNPKVKGRADMKQVSGLVKSRLSGA